MIKKIDVAGIQLDNYSAKESISHVEKNMGSPSLYTIEEISMDLILQAKEDERIREAIEMLNQTIISENGILNAVGDNSMQRKREIEDHDFFKSLLKRVERNAKTVFILGETNAEAEQLQDRIREEYPKIKVVGVIALEDCTGSIDAVLNEINAETPDVVISVIPSPTQEIFLLENKDKINANYWYGIGNMKFASGKKGLSEKIHRFLRLHKLERTITNYEETEVKEEQSNEQ